MCLCITVDMMMTLTLLELNVTSRTCVLQSKDNTFRGHTDSVDQLCWHPSNTDLLVTASGDKTVRLWDARSRKSVTTVPTKGTTLFGVADKLCVAVS